MNVRGIALCGAVAWTLFATPPATADELADAMKGCMDRLEKVENTLTDWKEPESRRMALAVQLVRALRLQAVIWPFMGKVENPINENPYRTALMLLTACAHPDWPWDLGIGKKR